jgi:pimeloyl-ACP methyl ester carboxylesterase
MEKLLNIKVDKKFTVHGRFGGSLASPLVIIVHGLPCSIMEGLYIDACRYFQKSGFATYRFNLYDWRDNSRQLIDSTLQTHASDLDAVVGYFRKQGVKKIYIAGHSFGGPTILLSRDQDFNAVALWDPSYDISFAKKKYGSAGGKYIKALNGYFMKWGANTIIGKKMADEVDRLKWDELTKNFYSPLKIISAENGILMSGAKKYFKNANQPKELYVVKGASHYFDETDKIQKELFSVTKDWFKRF